MEKLFVCNVCGHINFGDVTGNCPVCHASPDNFTENSDAIHPAEKEGKEKHVPVLTVTNACGLIPDACRDVHVKVGSVPHPMTEEHSIQWIDCYLDKKFMCRYMMAPQSLQATVGLHIKNDQKGTLTVVELCNKHGKWMSEAAL